MGFPSKTILTVSRNQFLFDDFWMKFVAIKSCVVTRLHGIDMSVLCVYPACVVSITLLKTESGRAAGQRDVENIILNISGRLVMIPRELHQRSDGDNNSVGLFFGKVFFLQDFMFLV